jgi:hypothetical protein
MGMFAMHNEDGFCTLKKWGCVLVMCVVLDSIGPLIDHAWRQI